MANIVIRQKQTLQKTEKPAPQTVKLFLHNHGTLLLGNSPAAIGALRGRRAENVLATLSKLLSKPLTQASLMKIRAQSALIGLSPIFENNTEGSLKLVLIRELKKFSAASIKTPKTPGPYRTDPRASTSVIPIKITEARSVLSRWDSAEELFAAFENEHALRVQTIKSELPIPVGLTIAAGLAICGFISIFPGPIPCPPLYLGWLAGGSIYTLFKIIHFALLAGNNAVLKIHFKTIVQQLFDQKQLTEEQLTSLLMQANNKRTTATTLKAIRQVNPAAAKSIQARLAHPPLLAANNEEPPPALPKEASESSPGKDEPIS
ncbi:MAG: hypothetical protein WCT39_00190 [Candidatus Margulisiibacteriota bacterium]